MATWEPKMPSIHDSLWSMKSTADGAWVLPSDSSSSMSDPPLLSKSFLDALTTHPPRNPSSHFSSNSSSSGLTSAATNNPATLEDKRFSESSKFHRESGAYQRSNDSSHLGRAAMLSAGLCKAETVDTHCVVTSTTAAATTAGSKTSNLLNASGSVGGSAKVTKKRARASRRPPTTVLEADSANFRAMVQQLTGIPSVPFLSPSLQRGGLDFLDLVRPPTKSLMGFGTQGLQGLPALDGSSLLHFGAGSIQSNNPMSRGQQHLHSDPAFASPYIKSLYMGSHDHVRQQPSMGDFLRTPLEELGLDQNANPALLSSLDQQQQQQQQQLFSGKLGASVAGGSCLSMPLLWDGDVRGGQNMRDLQLEELAKYKLAKSRLGAAATGGGDGVAEDLDQEGSAQIVDSWLSHADQNTEKLVQ